MQVKSIAECSKGSILQYFRHSLSYQLSLRPLFCLFLSCRFTQVLLYVVYCSALLFGKFIEFYQPNKVYLIIALNMPPKNVIAYPSYVSACFEEICICLQPDILHCIQHAFSLGKSNHIEKRVQIFDSTLQSICRLFLFPK